MNPSNTEEEMNNPNPAGHCVCHSAAGPGLRPGLGPGPGPGGALYLDSYEVSFPLDDGVGRPPNYHHLSQHMDEPVGAEPPHPHYSPFLLVSNLRAHLYVALEKNSWLQRSIEELEEERNFLRRQLERFIVSMRAPEECCGDDQRCVKAPPPCPPPPAPSSPMTTRSGMILKQQQGPGGRSNRKSSAPNTVSVKQEFMVDEEKFFTEEELLEEEEEEEEEEDEKGQKKKPRMTMRRIFRITQGRERQRVKDPEGVLIRYKKILTTYQRVRSMSRAFQIHGVDRNTMASTSPIAELLLVSPEKVADVGEFEASKEKLLDYARRCYKTMDEELHEKVQGLKKNHKLLPISYRFRN